MQIYLMNFVVWWNSPTCDQISIPITRIKVDYKNVGLEKSTNTFNTVIVRQDRKTSSYQLFIVSSLNPINKLIRYTKTSCYVMRMIKEKFLTSCWSLDGIILSWCLVVKIFNCDFRLVKCFIHHTHLLLHFIHTQLYLIDIFSVYLWPCNFILQ